MIRVVGAILIDAITDDSLRLSARVAVPAGIVTLFFHMSYLRRSESGVDGDFRDEFAEWLPRRIRSRSLARLFLSGRGFEDVMGVPAWKSLPSWYLVAENDEVIPPEAERQFAQRMGADTIEVASGHCAMVSHPEETHERIATAAKAAAVPG
jgi:pimeloyl-ACP methyl ester carboxylesterase